jgi:thiol-disulfide isomerase/thioredoxin
MPFSIVLLFVLLPQAQQSARSKDALALLNEVSQRYADTKSYHIEAVEERTTTSELSRGWQKTFMTAITMPGGRYRFEGRTAAGSASYVSDGTLLWDYLPDQSVYTRRPATSEDSSKKRIYQGAEIAALNAKSLRSTLAHRAEILKSATFLPDETIVIGEKSSECYVVRSAGDDFKVQHSGVTREQTVWIDKSRNMIVKIVERDLLSSPGGVNAHSPSTTESTVIYPVVELDQQEPASSFNFIPPENARLVEAFSDPVAPGPHPDFVGRPAAELRLKTAEGKITALSSFRGRPVFLDFWATWCGPCKGLVPDLLKLYDETSGQGLVWLGIDSDENPDAATKFVSQNHIPWPNYHDLDGSLGAAFQRTGIPLGILIDARGNIAFYQSGYEASDLRSAIAKLGPEFGSLAGADAKTKGESSK